MLIAILLANFNECLNNIGGGEDMANDVGKTDLFVTFANVHANQVKLIYLIQKKVELRRHLDNMMKQRKKQLTYESFWELRRG